MIYNTKQNINLIIRYRSAFNLRHCHATGKTVRVPQECRTECAVFKQRGGAFPRKVYYSKRRLLGANSDNTNTIMGALSTSILVFKRSYHCICRFPIFLPISMTVFIIAIHTTHDSTEPIFIIACDIIIIIVIILNQQKS